MAELAPAEIKALARIMDELDYYQLMHMKPGASPRDVKESYYSTSRTFHPDANHHLEGELRAAFVGSREGGRVLLYREGARPAALQSSASRDHP